MKLKYIVYLLLFVSMFSVKAFAEEKKLLPELEKETKTETKKAPQKINRGRLPASFENIPPILFVKGEDPLLRVFLKEAKVNIDVEMKITIGVLDAKGSFTHKIYGLPAGAKFDLVKSGEKKNLSIGTFTWKPDKTGLHAFAIEATSNTGKINRVAFFYDVKDVK